jgi:dimethylargininase
LLIAITREVSPKIDQCEITHVPRRDIDVNLAWSQHLNYESALKELGCKVRRLPAEPNLPDSVFVEDTAIVLDELAIITRPGAESRREETRYVSEVLEEYRPIFKIVSPGTLDGGDILQVGRVLYVGVTRRSNTSGIKQLKNLVSAYDYEVVEVNVDGCLHLKSAVTLVGGDALLINRSWVDAKLFKVKVFIDVDPGEQYAANALLVNDELIYPATFPKTRRHLENVGCSVTVVDVSELQKAEGGVTCCSLIFRDTLPIIDNLDI